MRLIFDSLDDRCLPTTASLVGGVLVSLAGRSSSFTLDGELSEAAKINRALSAPEVATLYDESRRGYPTMLRRSGTMPFASSAAALGWHPAIGVF